jgi:hypothetical protein
MYLSYLLAILLLETFCEHRKIRRDIHHITPLLSFASPVTCRSAAVAPTLDSFGGVSGVVLQGMITAYF